MQWHHLAAKVTHGGTIYVVNSAAKVPSSGQNVDIILGQLWSTVVHSSGHQQRRHLVAQVLTTKTERMPIFLFIKI